MKLLVDNDIFIIYLNKYSLTNIDLTDLDQIEKYFKKILEKINARYNIKIKGFYIIDIYLDDNYGAVIEMQKECEEYFEYDNQIEMTIFMHKTKFLYNVLDITNFLNYKNKILKYDNNYYIEIENNIQKMEFCKLEYKTDDIIKYGKIIEL